MKGLYQNILQIIVFWVGILAEKVYLWGMEKKILTCTGEHAHLNRFQFQLAQVERRKFILTEPLTGLKVAEGKTQGEAMQRLYAALEGVDLEAMIQEHLRCKAITKRFWDEVNQLYANRY